MVEINSLGHDRQQTQPRCGHTWYRPITPPPGCDAKQFPGFVIFLLENKHLA